MDFVDWNHSLFVWIKYPKYVCRLDETCLRCGWKHCKLICRVNEITQYLFVVRFRGWYCPKFVCRTDEINVCLFVVWMKWSYLFVWIYLYYIIPYVMYKLGILWFRHHYTVSHSNSLSLYFFHGPNLIMGIWQNWWIRINMSEYCQILMYGQEIMTKEVYMWTTMVNMIN